MVYLYHKIGTMLDVFDFVFLDIGIQSNIESVSENMYAWRELDALIQRVQQGDAMAVRDLSDLGGDPRDILHRLNVIMAGTVPLWISGLPDSYANRFDMFANRLVLGLLSYGLQAGAGGSVRRMPVGRPGVQYPDGWEKLYFDWKAGRLSAKDFLIKSGLKKATFYNRLADYAPIYEANLSYRNRYGIV